MNTSWGSLELVIRWLIFKFLYLYDILFTQLRLVLSIPTVMTVYRNPKGNVYSVMMAKHVKSSAYFISLMSVKVD